VAAAPTFVASGSAVGGTGAITVSWPAGIQADDIGLLFVESCNEAISLSSPSGFAEIPNSPRGEGTASIDPATRLAVFWCRATGTTMPDVVVADPGDHAVGRIFVYRGCENSGNPWDATAGAVQASTVTSISNPALSTTVDNCLVLMCASNATDSNTGQYTNWTNASLTGIVLRCNQGSISGNGGGIGIGEGTKATAGPVSSGTSTLSTASPQGLITIALKPPQAVPVDTWAVDSATTCVVADPVTFTGSGTLVVQTAVAVASAFRVTFVDPTVIPPGLGSSVLNIRRRRLRLRRRRRF